MQIKIPLEEIGYTGAKEGKIVEISYIAGMTKIVFKDGTEKYANGIVIVNGDVQGII